MDNWYRSSIRRYVELTTTPIATAIVAILLLTVFTTETSRQYFPVRLFWVVAIFNLGPGVLFAWCAAIVHVRGDDIVIHQLGSKTQVHWSDVEKVSRWYWLPPSIGNTPYVYTMKMNGRRRCVLFAHPAHAQWSEDEIYSGWVDFDYYATTPRDKWITPT